MPSSALPHHISSLLSLPLYDGQLALMDMHSRCQNGRLLSRSVRSLKELDLGNEEQ